MPHRFEGRSGSWESGMNTCPPSTSQAVLHMPCNSWVGMPGMPITARNMCWLQAVKAPYASFHCHGAASLVFAQPGSWSSHGPVLQDISLSCEMHAPDLEHGHTFRQLTES